MLDFYYSYAKRSMFAELFDDLEVCTTGFAERYTHTHQPSLHSSMVVLKISMPVLCTTPGDATATINAYGVQLQRVVMTGVERAVTEYNGNRNIDDPHLELDLASLNEREPVEFLSDKVTSLGRQLLVLIDEFDRAMVAAYRLSETGTEDNRAVGETVYKGVGSVVSSLLGAVKATNARLVITGIFPVPAKEWSVFNYTTNATHCKELAHTFGFSVEEVRELMERGDPSQLTLSSENLDAVMATIQLHYNGYRFSNSTYSVYNPQIVLNFRKSLVDTFLRNRDSPDLARVLADPNQKLLGSHVAVVLGNAKFQRALFALDLAGALAPEAGAGAGAAAGAGTGAGAGASASAGASTGAVAAVSGAAVTRVALTGPVQVPKANEGLDTLSYLFHAGIVTLVKPEVDATKPTAEFCIPNLVQKVNIIDALLRLCTDVEVKLTAFVASPTAALLAELLEAMMESKVLVPDHTEADLKVWLGGLLMHCKGQLSPTTLIEHHPGTDKSHYMDICVELPQCDTLAVLELKNVRRWRQHGKQQLNKLQEGVDGVDSTADDPRDVLRGVKDEEVRNLKCQYSGAAHTIDSLHMLAEEQARGYMTAIRTKPDSTKRTPTKVLGFAVTQVVDRFVVTEVAFKP